MNILFLSNPIRRDGAPLRLKEIVAHIKQEIPHAKIDLLTDRIEIENIFADLVDEMIIIPQQVHKSIKEKLVDWVKIDLLKSPKKDVLEKRLEIKSYDIIYANTIVTLNRAVKIKKQFPKAKLILHLRELEMGCTRNVPNYLTLMPYVDEVIAISKSVYAFAKEKCGFSEDKINLIYSGTHLDKLLKEPFYTKNKFIVGGVGGMTWRKGVDFFMIIANKVIKQNPNIYFEWVGLTKDDIFVLQHDLQNMGIENNVQLFPSNGDIHNLIKNWSIFTSMAREEPLGVAAIEAGALGIPYLSFRQTGGPEEIIGRGGGLLCNYLDVDGFTENILSLYNDKALYIEKSSAIRKNVAYYDINKSLNKITALIKKFDS